MRLLKTEIGDGLMLWYREDDRFMGQRMALRKYERFETALILKQINDNSVAVDVGANIGYYTILMAQKAKRVYAFEPEKINFEILKKNILENKLKNVVAVQVAVGNIDGEVGLLVSKENLGDHRVVTGNKKQVTRIKCVRLDDFVKEKVDLMKIDVQGFEPEVIEGASKIIGRDSPTIFMEYTPSEYKNDEMIKSLKSKYKNMWSINDFAEVAWPIFPGVKVMGEAGYADLWMKQKVDFDDYQTILKNVNYKKFIKGIMNSIWQK